jgi:hypothetical protein
VASLAIHTTCNRIQRFAGLDECQRSKVLPRLTGYELFFFYQVSYTFYSDLLRRMKYGATAQGSSFFAKTHRRLSVSNKGIIEGFSLESFSKVVCTRYFGKSFFRFFYGTGKTMSAVVETISNEKLAEMILGLGSRMDRMETDIRNDLGSRMDRMDSDIGDRIGRLERTVGAIESFPVPYGRPKSYYSATSMHSVSGAVRRRQSYAG